MKYCKTIVLCLKMQKVIHTSSFKEKYSTNLLWIYISENTAKRFPFPKIRGLLLNDVKALIYKTKLLLKFSAVFTRTRLLSQMIPFLVTYSIKLIPRDTVHISNKRIILFESCCFCNYNLVQCKPFSPRGFT